MRRSTRNPINVAKLPQITDKRLLRWCRVCRAEPGMRCFNLVANANGFHQRIKHPHKGR